MPKVATAFGNTGNSNPAKLPLLLNQIFLETVVSVSYHDVIEILPIE